MTVDDRLPTPPLFGSGMSGDENQPLLKADDNSDNSSGEHDEGDEMNQQLLGVPDSGPRKKTYSVTESTTSDTHLIAVFVTRFDTLKGNIVEWSYPNSFMLPENVAFKSICSGWHRVSNDFVYFKVGDHFSLACFNNLHVDNEKERGARMCSVGVLVNNYPAMSAHFDYLYEEAKRQNKEPGQYDRLIKYFDEHSAQQQRMQIPQAIDDDIVKPASFGQFMNFLGEPIFLVWKALLLRKRILFYTPVPVGVVCDRVHSSCDLLQNSDPSARRIDDPVPLFYVNVADIDDLKRFPTFVACTTEKIFEMKTELYDVFVNNQNVEIKEEDKGVLKLTNMDKKHFARLMELRSHRPVVGARQSFTTDNSMKDYLRDLNNRLFSILSNKSQSSRLMKTSEMPNLGLAPSDRKFLQALADVHGLNVEVKAPCPCL